MPDAGSAIATRRNTAHSKTVGPRLRRLVFARHPRSEALAECFRMEEAPLPAPAEGEVLLRNLWLSIDICARGRMDPDPPDGDRVELGGVMPCASVARVECGTATRAALVARRARPGARARRRPRRRARGGRHRAFSLPLLPARRRPSPFELLIRFVRLGQA